jgi:hypothetical protein
MLSVAGGVQRVPHQIGSGDGSDRSSQSHACTGRIGSVLGAFNFSDPLKNKVKVLGKKM